MSKGNEYVCPHCNNTQVLQPWDQAVEGDLSDQQFTAVSKGPHSTEQGYDASVTVYWCLQCKAPIGVSVYGTYNTEPTQFGITPQG